jgi:catechol 2,3-dioxygenase-like lactoylglutathione lyase family enzyme
MSLRLEAVSFDSVDPVVVGTFWGTLLGREIVQDANGVLLPGDGLQVGLRFVEGTTELPKRNRLHLHLTNESVDDQRQTVETVLRLGGRRPGTKPPPLGRIVYMNDPDGNEFCVIEPGNEYLAGCGYLGEITCNGARATGLFWREALDWVLVWDEGEQIAIQSREGGAKIGWDIWAETKGDGWNRQRFDLLASDIPAEIERLTALGATQVSTVGGVVKMADPDGSEFVVRADFGPN